MKFINVAGLYIGLWKNEVKVGHLIGVDITNIATQNLKAKFPDIRLYTADIFNDTELQLVSNNNQFDIVSAFDVLFHITDDSKFEQAKKMFTQC